MPRPHTAPPATTSSTIYHSWQNSRDFALRAAASLLEQALKAHTPAFEAACLNKAESWEAQASYFADLLATHKPPAY